MEWLIAALAVVVLGLAALAASGKLGSMPPPVDDVYAPHVPTSNITANDLRRARFGVSLRGYDMRQVDDLLDRLARQLETSRDPEPASAELTDDERTEAPETVPAAVPETHSAPAATTGAE